MTPKADELRRRIPDDEYRAPQGMPELHLVFPYEEAGKAELLAAIKDARVLAGEGYISLSDENWGVADLWYDGERWQIRKWTHYSPSEDCYANAHELWRDLMDERMPEAANDN